jgi:hypothetical protein
VCARVGNPRSRSVVLQGYNYLFGAFSTNVEISTNQPTATSRKIRNQALITGCCSFRVQTHFGDSNGESTTSRTSSMKGGNSGTNGSDLNKNNIIKPTFETLMEEGRKAFKACGANIKELFLSHYEVTRQGTILKDTTSIIFHKAEIIPEVQPNPSPSHNDIQSMITSTLERQAKSTTELLHRLIEDRDGKNLTLLVLILLLFLALLVLLKLIHKQVVHRRAALQCPTPQPSR